LEISFINIFLEGTALGLSLAFLFGFGPAFFALLQTALHRGFVPAAFLAFGILLNDAAIIAVMVLGATKALSDIESYKIVGVVGGLLLIAIGLFSYRKSSDLKSQNNTIDNNGPHKMIYIAKGFVLNLANPFVWIFWLGIVVGITARFSADAEHVLIFFAGALLIVFATDLLKAFMANSLKKYLTDRFLIMVNKIAGIALMGFGLFLIIRSLVVM